jgi:hypothetical protein
MLAGTVECKPHRYGHRVQYCLQPHLLRFKLGSNFVPHPRQGDVGIDPREKFLRAKWLDQIIVRASLEAFDFGLLAGARRQQDYRKTF